MQDWETAYWDGNFDRLRKIKAKYDSRRGAFHRRTPLLTCVNADVVAYVDGPQESSRVLATGLRERGPARVIRHRLRTPGPCR
ncbi:BBE domain-containing protein [Streptomyces odonnellii]|uniref:BBE domain-containing protein n=1 Tax=Streptomyces odonnellii TaxID=1417980 RepID=UPI001E3EC194|nr:BBE domain-containing protein [Streptomyces odonnellii]